MFARIVVGTDGSETAAEAVRQATELAKLTGAKLDLVSAFEPIPQQRLKEEASEVPGDVAYGVGPREDVNTTLENAAGPARNERRRDDHPCPRGRSRRRDPRRRRGDERRPHRRRQQGDDGRQALPARQRPEQGLPSRPLQRDDRPHDLAPAGAGPALLAAASLLAGALRGVGAAALLAATGSAARADGQLVELRDRLDDVAGVVEVDREEVRDAAELALAGLGALDAAPSSSSPPRSPRPGPGSRRPSG